MLTRVIIRAATASSMSPPNFSLCTSAAARSVLEYHTRVPTRDPHSITTKVRTYAARPRTASVRPRLEVLPKERAALGGVRSPGRPPEVDEEDG